ncbi:MAG: hypothetical protein RL684_3318 [Pseudomonadota bacterium]|jgi:hypothetical protein
MGWLQLVGMGISAIAEHQAGQEAQAAANTEADGLLQDAALKAANVRRLGVQTQSQARAAMAASGVDVNSTSGRVIDENIATNSERDVSSALVTGERNALTVRMGGAAAARGADINALGTVVGGLGSPYGQSALGKLGGMFSGWKTSGSGVGTQG